VRALLALLAGAVALFAGGCGGATTSTIDTHRADPKPGPRATVEPSSCPSGVAGCRSARGRIVYFERIDPDGDGDAHFVIADAQGITLPGLTAIDVRRGLRPRPLPGAPAERRTLGRRHLLQSQDQRKEVVLG
jgi:hypothetical protein